MIALLQSLPVSHETGCPPLKAKDKSKPIGERVHSLHIVLEVCPANPSPQMQFPHPNLPFTMDLKAFPPEIRLEIFKHVLVPDRALKITKKRCQFKPTSYLRSGKKLRPSDVSGDYQHTVSLLSLCLTSRLFYNEFFLEFEGSVQEVNDFFRPIRPENNESMRRLTLGCMHGAPTRTLGFLKHFKHVKLIIATSFVSCDLFHMGRYLNEHELNTFCEKNLGVETLQLTWHEPLCLCFGGRPSQAQHTLLAKWFEAVAEELNTQLKKRAHGDQPYEWMPTSVTARFQDIDHDL